MNVLTNAIYWIATGLLVPVVLGLMILLVCSLLQIGDMFGAFLERRSQARSLRGWSERLLDEPVRFVLTEDGAGNSAFLRTLRRCIAVDWHPIHASRLLAEHELASRKGLDFPTLLIRTGPMLGLMGTLIHVGPAIRGLAAGDLAAMAGDIEVVFTITVLGIFVGALGFWVKTVRQRWAQADAIFLHYAFELAQAQQDRETSTMVSAKGDHHAAFEHAKRDGVGDRF